MATLQNIRKKGPLVAVIIGFALLAFILGDAVRSGSFFFSGKKDEIAEVAGNSIRYSEYYKRVNQMEQFYKLQSGGQLDSETSQAIMEQSWQQMIRDYVLQEQLDELGLTVSPTELTDYIQGKNIDPMVVRMFMNPKTGQFNPAQITQFLKNWDDLPDDNKTYWMQVENEILNKRIQTKYNNLITKGLFPTTTEAKAEFKAQHYFVDFNYVRLPIESIPNNAVTISEDDLETYYEENKHEYFVEEPSRDLVYIPFDIKPSEADFYAAENYINRMKADWEKRSAQEDFETGTDDAQFVRLNSDTPFDALHYGKGELDDRLDTIMHTKEPGFIYGPYLENNTYKLVKLTGKRMIVDSVEVRHILIQPNDTLDNEKAKQLALAIKKRLETDTIFGAIARQYSSDGGSKDKGGYLGWIKEGRTVKPFNDTCFNSATKKGDLMVVESKYGQHVIEILNKGEETMQVQVGILTREVIPSQETRDKIYAQASEFAGKNNTSQRFQEAAKKQNIQIRHAGNIQHRDRNVPGLENPDELVKWAYNSELNTVSSVFELGDQFVIAVLTNIREKGTAPLSQVKSEIKMAVTKQKKGEMLQNKMNEAMQNAKTIDALSANLSLQVDTAKNVNFSSNQFNGLFELNVIATAQCIEKNVLSKSIIGESGVYGIVVTSVTQAPETDFASEKTRLTQTFQWRAKNQAYRALEKNAEIVDNRDRLQ